MSYLDNIRITLLENAQAITRQGSWPQHSMKGAAHHDKLRRYFNLAGGNVFLINSDDPIAVNVGWAGKKKKEQMRHHNRITIGTKRAKVSRRRHLITNWRMMGLRNLIMQHVVPVGVETPTSLTDYSTVLIIRNHKVGSLTFTGPGQPPLTVAIREDKLLNQDQVLDAWSCFTRMKSSGEVIPFYQKSPWSRAR